MAKRKTESFDRVERNISAAMCILLCVVTVAAQIATVLLLVKFLQEKASFVYGVLQLIGVVVAVRVYQRPGSPSYKLSWMCLLLILPVAGLLLFWTWGGSRQAKQLSLKAVPAVPQRESQRMASATNLGRLNRKSPAWGRIAAYLQKRGFCLYDNTEVEYYSDGEVFFDELIARIEKAKTYIFLEYYILAEGEIWDRMLAALRKRAAAGVEVYIIFDDFGNLTRLSDDMLQRMQDAGIEVGVFNPVHRYINRIYFNFRDHRKIAVIDGWDAYTGGFNIGDEYANLVERYGHWKDSAVHLTGEGAWGFAAQFIQMWKMMGKVFPNEDDYYRPHHEEELNAAGYCQPFTDGPHNNPDNPVEEVYLQLIASAQKMLYITTPYYAVEESMQQALCIAADAGVDVRLCIPAIPDHKLAYMMAETYWGDLLRHGVKIYKYSPGFLHAKSVMVDREVALVGSTNMDYRTFQLHYECAVLLYHVPVIEEILEDLDHVMKKSKLYTLQEWEHRPWLRRTAAAILRLGAIWI